MALSQDQNTSGKFVRLRPNWRRQEFVMFFVHGIHRIVTQYFQIWLCIFVIIYDTNLQIPYVNISCWYMKETTNCYTISCTSGHSLQISNKTFRIFKCNIHESAIIQTLAPAFPDKENRERTSTNLKQTIGRPTCAVGNTDSGSSIISNLPRCKNPIKSGSSGRSNAIAMVW